MKVIRIVFGFIGAVWLIGMFAFGLGTTWLSHDPEAAAGVALGAMAVDADASVGENANAFAGGYNTGKDLAASIRDGQEREALRSSCRESADSDWGQPQCDALAEHDRATYEKLNDGW